MSRVLEDYRPVCGRARMSGKIGISALVFLGLACSSVFGQAVSQISGTVADSSGAGIPDVQITATQTDTGTARTVTSDASGTYALTNLPIGPYRIDAMKPGFRSYTQTGIVLQVDSAPVIPITLPVGEVSTKIEVEANANQVETTTMGVANVVDQQKVLDLPLNGRQPTDLITLSGAAVQTGTSPEWGMATGVTISIAGGLDYGVGYALDGAGLSNFYDATGFPLPFPDALQEFKVETSSLTAMTGTHSAGSVNAVTRAGSNAFHGDLFEFLRNGDLNARNFFAPQRDDLKRNQFGGVIGGPIKKDKLFFFAGYQGTTIRTDQANNLAFVPTAAELQGNFTGCGGGVIPNFQLDPAAAKIVSFLPKGSGPCGEIRFGIPNNINGLTVPTVSGQIVGRIDYQQSQSNTIFGRYIATWDHAPVPYLSSGNNVLDTSSNGLDDLAQSAALGDTWLINPQTVNTLRLSMNREATNHPGPSFFGPTDVGINNYAAIPKSIWLNVPGSFNIGSGVAANLFLYNTTVQLNDDVSLIRGKHQFTFGGNVAQALIDGLANVFSQGLYIFEGSPGESPLAGFLQGQLTVLRQEAPNGLIEYEKFFGLYAQDTWKISHNFTLNYGVRWEPFFPVQSKDKQSYAFSMSRYQQGLESTVYPNAPPGFLYPGDPGFNGQSAVRTVWKDFQPRVGFAWDPFGDGKTSIRGGAGIAYDFFNMELFHNTVTAAPFGGSVTLVGVSLDNPYANFPGGNPFPYVSTPGHGVFPAGGQYLPMPANLQPPEVQQWNLAVQRQISKQWFASATYLGNHGLHETNQIELNPAIPVGGVCNPSLAATNPAVYFGLTTPTCSSPNNVNARRILNLQKQVKAAGISNLTAYDNGATSDYNGLLLSTTYQFNTNFNFNANYTWSHCVGDLSIGDQVPNPGHNTPNDYVGGNRRLDRGNCFSDIRQIFNLTAVAQSPHYSGSLLGRLASDWRLSVIDQYRTGIALNLNTGIDNELNGENSFSFEEPNQLLKNPYGSGLNFLNPAAFATPALGTHGNNGVYNLTGPSFWELDTALSRLFRIGEHQTVEARWEAFNITNSMRPLVQGVAAFTTLNSGTFGQITQAYDPRIMQFALKYVF